MSVNIASVMVKYPELNKVKTRLAESIGSDKALQVYQLLIENLSEKSLPTEENNYTFGSFVTPADKIVDFQFLYSNYAFYHKQDGNNLGERMFNAFLQMFTTQKADKAILIGADIPDLTNTIIEDAFMQLDYADIVLGPTTDGGYYLIGMKSVHKEIFENIDWGTSDVLNSTLNICRAISLEFKLLEILSDVDTYEDLQKFPEFINKMQ